MVANNLSWINNIKKSKFYDVKYENNLAKTSIKERIYYFNMTPWSFLSCTCYHVRTSGNIGIINADYAFIHEHKGRYLTIFFIKGANENITQLL